MLEKELKPIVENELDVIPFLKKLTPKDKRSLVPFVKKLRKGVFEYQAVTERSAFGTSTSYKLTSSEKQRGIVAMVCMVCYNKADARRAGIISNCMTDDIIEKILPWFVPKWYSDLINEATIWGLSYEKVMRLYKMEVLEITSNLIRNCLPRSIVLQTYQDNKHKRIYTPEVLLKYPETLEHHIWHLFEGESVINNFYEFNRLDNYDGDNDLWIDTFWNLVDQEKIERNKILQATIFTATKGLNKTLSGWFYDLLIRLNPSQEEIIKLQDEFFAALNSPHSKVVNTVLKYFKLVAGSDDFQKQVFIENASILLNSETKSVVNSTLMILDKIAKSDASLHIMVCQKSAEALIHLDEKIQARSAKLISKYGSAENQEIADEVMMYVDGMFHSTKEILIEFLSEEAEKDDDEMELEEKPEDLILTSENEIPKFESFDAILFFISQSVDNNEVYHLDLLMHYLPKLFQLIDKTNVAKLKAIAKRTFQLTMGRDWNSSIGSLEREAGLYITEIVTLLMERYPSELSTLITDRKKKIKELKENRLFSQYLQHHLLGIGRRPIPDYIYQTHRFLFRKSLSNINKGIPLEMLSTPTHAPCWVDPVVLVKRIEAYEKANVKANRYDLQIAIGRLPVKEYDADTIDAVHTIEDIEVRNSILYHLGELSIHDVTIKRPNVWLAAVLNKNDSSDIKYFQEQLSNPMIKERGAQQWACDLVEYTYMDWDYKLSKRVEKKGLRKELHFKNFNPSLKEDASILSSIKRVFGKSKKVVHLDSFYEYLRFKKELYYTTIQPHDDVKFLYLSPNNPGAFLVHVIYHNLRESTFQSETSKKNMVNLLKGLYEIWYRPDYSEATYLFLATGLLCSDKVSREVAAELWVKAVAEDTMNNAELGTILGTLESKEYAPIKRFTDVLTATMLNISKKHNQGLFTLLKHMISSMDVPIKGLKKMLELFYEMRLGAKDVELGDAVKNRFEDWKSVKSLKPIINKIEKI